MSEKEPRFYEQDKISILTKGEQLPSVTSVLDCTSKYGLLMFYGKWGIKKAKEISLEASMIGTGVHDYISDSLRGLKLPTPAPKFRNSIDNFKKFKRIYKPEIEQVEKVVYSICPVCSEMRAGRETEHSCIAYAGTADAICNIEGKRILLDWKTSKSLYDDYKLQIEAYTRALHGMEEERNKPEIDEMWLVQLDKEESFDDEKHILKLKLNAHRFNAFIGLLNYFRWSRVLKNV